MKNNNWLKFEEIRYIQKSSSHAWLRTANNNWEGKMKKKKKMDRYVSLGNPSVYLLNWKILKNFVRKRFFLTSYIIWSKSTKMLTIPQQETIYLSQKEENDLKIHSSRVSEKPKPEINISEIFFVKILNRTRAWFFQPDYITTRHDDDGPSMMVHHWWPSIFRKKPWWPSHF